MDLFEEIREDIVKTKYIHLWQSYGKYAVAGIILLVISLLAYFIIYEHKNKTNINNTNKLYKLIQDNNKGDYKSFLSSIDNLIDNSPVNHQSYAILQKANYDISNNNISLAYNALIQLFNDNNVYKPYRDFSELLLNYIIFKYPTEETFDSKIIENITNNNIFYYNILEIRALCFIEQNKIGKARNELQKILNAPNISPDSKKFTIELLELLKYNPNLS